MTITAHQINSLLPQTQCRECGYDGCLPYAQALANHQAPVNLCIPGGEAVMLDIAGLLQQTPVLPSKTHTKALAWIDESACIGCTACIRACPVDAIMGASKLMHTVISTECTGCGLCVSPCPVDCIYMQPVDHPFLPLARHLSAEQTERFSASGHALARFEHRNNRRQRDEEARKRQIAEREAASKARLQPTTESTPKPAFNPMDLIAKAMAKAQEQQTQLAAPDNRISFKAKQMEEAKERAELRRAQRDMKYGNDEEKAAALVYLQRYKAEQEALKSDKRRAKQNAANLRSKENTDAV